MSEIANPPPVVVDLENCTCLERTFFAIGLETGNQIREMVKTQIENHRASMDSLNALLQMIGTPVTNPGNICTKNQVSSAVSDTPTDIQ